MRLLLFILFICTAPLFSNAQANWRTMIGNPDFDFATIQQSFYAEFGDEVGAKGSGWKQFKRWEYYQEQRLDSLGNYPAPGHVQNEMLHYRETHPSTKAYVLGSGNWELLGPIVVPNNGTGQPNGNGRLSCIAFHPTDANTVYVGAPAGGIWKTTDNGLTWTHFLMGLTRLGISGIIVHPTNPDTIYVASGDRDGGDVGGYGVWRSVDGGLTWLAHNNGMGNRTVNEILMDPTNSNIMIAATSGSRIYRTTDGGANWVNTANLGYTAKDIAYHPTNSNIVYASGTGFHKSVDAGVTWTEITSGVPVSPSRIAIAVSIDEPDWVYLLAGDGNGLVGIYRSEDSGNTFSTRTTSPNIMGYATNGGAGSQAWYDIVIVADPTDANTIYTGGINIWKSTNGGTNMSLNAHWTGSGGVDPVHADQHVLEFSPHNNNLYNGNDGGFYITTDGGTVWNDFSDGLAIAQIYKIGVSQQTLDKAINGYQDNGTAINTGTSFITEIGGDGMECIIDPTDDTYVYGALYYGDIRRSTNGGTSFGNISNSISESGGWVTPYKLDPNNANRMFAGYNNVWRNNSVRTGAAWTRISFFANTSNMVDIAIAPSNSNIMYVSKGGSNNFYRTTDALAASPTWTNLEAALPATGTPRDIEIDPTDQTHLFIALGDNIYESTNSGASWTNISGTLPNISLNTIVIDKDSPLDAMYIGMDVGVYYKDNTMADWLIYDNGIPNVEVTELEIHYNGSECKSMLYAATYGLGLWKSDLKDPGNLSTVACFEASSTEVCLGETVTFKDYTSYTPTSWTWTISPATFTFVGGTNANSQNPQVSFNAAGTYGVQLNSSNAIGNDLENKVSYITVSSADIATSFNNDFESEALCGTATNCATTTCPLANPLWINLTNGTEDDIDWRVDQGGTGSSGTGPSVDYNPGTSTGNYAYLEASGGCTGRTALLESTCLMVDQNYDFVYKYHMLGGDMGSLHLDVNNGGTWTLDIIPAIEGDQGNEWKTSTFNLAAYVGQTLKFRIRGITGNGFESDITIDDIALVPVVVLPITLLSFDAELLENNSVKLEWATAVELNTNFYEIERSSDAVNWTPILNEEAAGNSNSILNYEALDRTPGTGISYYRLKDVDFDGSFSYSQIRSVNIEGIGNSDINVFPNPTGKDIVIKGKALDINQFKFYSILGQDVTNFTRLKSGNESELKIDLSNLTKGIYYIRTNNTVVKIFKQ